MTTVPTHPAVRDDLAMVELDGELVVYDHAGHGLHHLNRTATAVFRCLDARSTVGEIVADIVDVTGLPRADVDRDVQVVVTDFVDQGLVVVEPAPGAARNGEVVHVHHERLTVRDGSAGGLDLDYHVPAESRSGSP